MLKMPDDMDPLHPMVHSFLNPVILDFVDFMRSRTHPLTEFANRYYETVNVSFFCFSPVHANRTTFVRERNLVEVVNVKDMVNDSILCRVYLNASHVYNLHCNSLLLSIMQFGYRNFREVHIARDRLVIKFIKIPQRNCDMHSSTPHNVVSLFHFNPPPHTLKIV